MAHGDVIAVRTDGLAKQYHIGVLRRTETLYERIGGLLGQQSQLPPELDDTVWALRDLSLEVPQGHVLGILGRNGSGKSTLLKILARVTAPTSGSAETFGRVAALLEVGTGFHPELTGRENIAMSGSILGMTRADIAAMHGPIVEFAEIGRYLETPVKYYSSGMYLRLAFSVTVHLRAEIMLVDEVLAVGDVGFQMKCLQRIREVVAEGRTVLYVSHSLESVRALCDSAIVLDQGAITYSGPTDDAIGYYLDHLSGISPRLRTPPQDHEVLVASHAPGVDGDDVEVR